MKLPTLLQKLFAKQKPENIKPPGDCEFCRAHMRRATLAEQQRDRYARRNNDLRIMLTEVKRELDRLQTVIK